MMILKEKAFTQAKDWKQAAGDAAEKEMAHYLRRYFGDESDVLVLNDIRLEMDGDAAQMDHLLIHRGGLTIIESKSVSGKLQMKPDGEWLRWYEDRSQGMASPLVQARLQAEFLRKFLRRMAKQPQVIDALQIDFYIAISSKGQFIAPRGMTVAEVCKADLIGDRVRGRLQCDEVFGAPYRKVLGDYLVRMHSPLSPPAKPAEPTPPAPQAVPAEPVVVQQKRDSTDQPAKKTADNFRYIGDSLPEPGLLGSIFGTTARRKVYATFCRSCSSEALEFRYGKFGYFLRCLNCGGNTAIKMDCRKCGRQPRLRKDDNLLYVECQPCGLSEVLHRNGKTAEVLSRS